MTALRVAVVHTDPLPGEKAGSLTVARSAAGLADNDTGVVLIMRDGGGTLEQALRAIELEPPEGLSVLRLASYGPFSVRHTGWFARGVARALLRLPEAEAPDVILVRNPRSTELRSSRHGNSSSAWYPWPRELAPSA